MGEARAKAERQLKALSDSYAGQLPEKLAEIEAAADRLMADGPADDLHGALRSIHALAHKLAGSAATFGYPDLSRCASHLEVQSGAYLGKDRPPSPQRRRLLDGLARGLRRSAENGGRRSTGEAATLANLPDVADGDRKIVILVDDDEIQARRFELELSAFGYRVRRLSHSSLLRDAVAESPPATVVMDIVFEGDNQPGLTVVANLRREGALVCPVVFLSARDDIEARLAAVRAGGDGYLIKPVGSNRLVDSLDRLTASGDAEPYRILIVDDDPSMARYVEVILRTAGMIAESVTEPMDVLESLDAFAPELILMDLYMPACSGAELAAVIRQKEDFAGIPIVYLSGELNVDKQLRAMRRGGDDFLNKPIRPDRLISSVTTRAERFRLLRSKMVRDSLTGLLNHSTTLQQLEVEVARARRDDARLAFAMIDIDRFKAVNDTYGHAIGDQVIISLARLLKRRLRGTDVIGRMGGEEFAVALFGSGAEDAFGVFDTIRKEFSGLRYGAGESRFATSLSCGIAEFPRFETTSTLLAAADKALYAAKRGGRDRVVVAGTHRT